MNKFLILLSFTLLLSSCASSRFYTSVKPEIKTYEFPQSYKDIVANKGNSLKKYDKEFLSNELFLKANYASIHGDYELATILYRELLKLNTDDDYVRQQYGINLIASGHLEESQKHFEILYDKSKKKNSNIGLVLAGVYISQGLSSEAEDVYKQILKVDRGHEEACVFLAKSYAKDKHYSKATKLLSSCNTIAKKPIFPYYKGKIAIERGKENRALKYFKRAIKIDPGFYQAVLGAGLILESKNKANQAMKIYDRYLNEYGDQYAILSRAVYILMDKDVPEELVTYLERLIPISNDDLNLKVKLGILYTDLNRIDDAKGIFKEILYVATDSDKILYYLGTLYQQTDDYDNAITYFAKIESDSPLFFEGNLNIGKMLSYMSTRGERKEENFKKLNVFITETSKKHPKLSAPLQIVLANYYDDIGQTSVAIDILEKIKETDSFTTDDQYFLALLHDKEGNTDKTKLALNSIIKKHPDNADALNFLGYTLLEEGKDLKSALAFITKAVQIKPLDGYIRDSLGWYYYKTGDYKRALAELKKAWELVQDDVTISKHLGLVYQEIGDYKNAQRFYQKALANCKDNSPEKENILELINSVKGSKRLPASN